MPDGLSEHIRDAVMAMAEARERACEAAIQTGGCGVLETWCSDGSVTFEVTARVPYGHIWVQQVDRREGSG